MDSDVLTAYAYASASEHLRDVLSLVFLRVQRHIAVHGHRMLQADGRMSNLYVSFREARHLLGRGEPEAPRGAVAENEGWPGTAEIDPRIDALGAHIAARLELTAGSPSPAVLPIEELRSEFRLSQGELDLLLAAAAPQLSTDLARLYTFAWADFAVKLPSVAFLAELTGLGEAGLPGLAEAFGADATLIRRRLLRLRDVTSWGSPTPLLHRGVVVADSVVEALLGAIGPLPPPLDVCARLHRPEDAVPRERLVMAAELATQLGRAFAGPSGARGRLLCLEGSPGSGRRSLLAALAAGVGQGVLEVEVSALARAPGGLFEALADAARESALRHAVLLLRADHVLSDAAWLDQHGVVLARACGHLDGMCAITARRAPPVLLHHAEHLATIDVPRASGASQKLVWTAALEAIGAPSEVNLDAVIGRFDMTPGAIVRAAQSVQAALTLEPGRTRDRPRLTTSRIMAAVSGRVEHSLGELAERLETTLEWADAVLPQSVEEGLTEILNNVRYRSLVYDEWGFRRKLSYGRGLSCLFSGPPGTGKTMMAGVIARSVGVDAYRIDLSRVSSKWVGETEKNLARLFDEAEKAQVILLFDEADSLFSRRTSVQSANDRFANMEINFLLQRMEAYDGMTILTTNFEESIDVAFKRRIRHHVHFPMPDEALRARLWRSMFPPGVRIDPSVSFERLGERFPIAGGNIKNAALRAAFQAAGDGGVVTQAHLVKAATAEAQTVGLAVRSGGA